MKYRQCDLQNHTYIQVQYYKLYVTAQFISITSPAPTSFIKTLEP